MVIPGLAVLTFLVFEKNIREIFRMHVWLGIGLFLILTLPWFVSLWQQGGVEYLKVFFIHNHLERFAGGSTGHAKPFYYYLTQFPGGFLPWSLLLVPVFWWSFRNAGEADDRSRKGVLFAKCWFISGFVFLSIASTKRVLYLMPIFAPIALLTANYVEACLKRTAMRKFEDLFILLFGVVLLAVGLAAIPLYFYVSTKYALGVPLMETAATVVLALAAAALSAVALHGYKQKKNRFWAFSGASIFSLLLLGLVAVVPLLDHYKSFVPFCDKVKITAGGAPDLYAYKPDETLRGAVPFYTGQFLKEVDSLEQLESAIEKDKARYVVIRDKRQAMERELLSSGRLNIINRSGMDAARSLVLFKSNICGDGS